MLLTCVVAGQNAAPAPSQPATELPDSVRIALEQIEDASFSFDQPGFYAVLEHVKTATQPPGHARPPIDVTDWAALLERATDFRGLPITIEGTVGRNTAWQFQQAEHRHLGTVWQLELWRADQPIAATVILTHDASDIPVGSSIRVAGYFVMIRQYYSNSNRLRQAALLVAPGPTMVSQAVARNLSRPASDWIVGLVVACTAALIIAWLLLRRSVGPGRRMTTSLRASEPAPTSLADDLARWAAEEPELSADDDTDDDRAGQE